MRYIILSNIQLNCVIYKLLNSVGTCCAENAQSIDKTDIMAHFFDKMRELRMIS